MNITTKLLLGLAGILSLIPSALGQGLNSDQKRRAESLMAIWENGTIIKQYGYAENIGDDRGITFGWYGATTADGDAIPLYDRFEALHPNNPLTPFADQIHDRNVSDESGFIRAVHDSDAGEFKADFEAAQDAQADIEYYQPAVQQAAQLGLQSAAGLAELYDSEINHGVSGVVDLINRTNSSVGGTPASGVDEVTWLDAYLDNRYDVLAADPTWRTSTDRAAVFKSQIVDAGNLNLDGPIHIVSRQYGTYDIP